MADHYNIIKVIKQLLHSTKFWRWEILADSVDSPVTTKILPSKCITLCYTASSVMFNRQNITIQKHL